MFLQFWQSEKVDILIIYKWIIRQYSLFRMLKTTQDIENLQIS